MKTGDVTGYFTPGQPKSGLSPVFSARETPQGSVSLRGASPTPRPKAQPFPGICIQAHVGDALTFPMVIC